MNLLNTKQAREYLNLNRYNFNNIVNSGSLGYKLVGSRKFFPRWELDRWLKDTQNHTDCSKEAISTTPISRSFLKPEREYSLEKLLELYRNKPLG